MTAIYKGTITPADERVYGVWDLNDTDQVAVLAEPERRPCVRLGVGNDTAGHHVMLSVEDARDIAWTILRAARQVEEAQTPYKASEYVAAPPDHDPTSSDEPSTPECSA